MMWDLKSIWNPIEKWGRSNPVRLAIAAFLVGLVPPGTVAFVGGYNLGVYAGAHTSDRIWGSQFDEKLKQRVNAQLAAKCGQAVSEVEITCNRDTASLKKTVAEKNAQIHDQNSEIESLQRKSDILDMYSRMVDNAVDILKSLQAASARHDVARANAQKGRFFSLLLDIRRLNHLYQNWGELFDGQAADLANKYNDAQSVPTDAAIGYLEYFTADIDRKRKVVESEVNEANKIMGRKY